MCSDNYFMYVPALINCYNPNVEFVKIQCGSDNHTAVSPRVPQ